MPRLWETTIDAHRHHVTDAILETTVGLVNKHGLRAVTMSEIAEQTGIGRATLYKYFPDVESILRAWHGRQIEGHLGQLVAAGDRAGAPGERVAAVFHEYALITHGSRGHADTELAALMHRDHQVGHAEQRLHTMFRDLLRDAAEAGDIRDDVAPAELATYCAHALTAASGLSSKAAVTRLVEVTLDGLRRG